MRIAGLPARHANHLIDTVALPTRDAPSLTPMTILRMRYRGFFFFFRESKERVAQRSTKKKKKKHCTNPLFSRFLRPASRQHPAGGAAAQERLLPAGRG